MFLSSGRKVNLAGANWLGLPESPLGQIPGKPEATLTLPHKTVVSQHPERPQGQPKMRSEDRRAPTRLACGPCPASVSPILTGAAREATGRWAEERLRPLIPPSLDPAPCSFPDTHLY